MTNVESAFSGAGKVAGLELWRIEQMAPARVADVKGKFFQGDSYILLSTVMTKSGTMNRAIHFWLGSASSQDEQGVAAFKTVELDELLGGSPVQYREVEGNESQLFLSYFKSSGGVEYLPGGVDSGFHHVVRDVFPTRLLQLKGKRTVRVKEIPLSIKSLTQGDVYILDCGLKIYIFNAPGANMWEKTKGVEVATSLDSDSRGGRAEIFHVEDDPKNPDFWGPLGGYQDPSTLAQGEDDTEAVQVKVSKLFKLADVGDAVELIQDGTLKKSLLVSENVYLLHSTEKICLWVGKHSKMDVKKNAMHTAVEFIKKNNLPSTTAVERVTEGVETASFKSLFLEWNAAADFSAKFNKNAVKKEDEAIDVQKLLAVRSLEQATVDDGSGKVEVWSVVDFKLQPVPVAKYGQFYGGDSYVVLYTYQKNKKTEHIIYFWLGHTSSTDEIGSAALLASEMDKSLGGRPVQVRVTQGKEPLHFVELFKGKTIVHKGGKASSFKNSKEADSIDVDGVALFQVKGTTETNTKASQVTEVAGKLNSEDVFVLVTPATVFLWKGVGSLPSEVAVGLKIATILAGDFNGKGGRAIVQVAEKEESDAFWGFLGGKGEYPAFSKGSPHPREARLFQGSTATGTFKIEEIAGFDQSDLVVEDIFILDTYTQLFLWIGEGSTEDEKVKGARFAKQFIADAKDGRDLNIPVITVSSGSEPHLFTCHFMAWDDELAGKNKFEDIYEKKKSQLAADKAAKEASAPVPSIAANASLTTTGVPPLVKQGSTLRNTTGTTAAAPQKAAGSVDYLSTIKRDSQNKSGENVFAPKATVPAYAKMTLKPVPSGMKKDGVPISTIAAPTHIVTPAPAAIKPKDKDRDEPITVASAVAALKLTEKPKIPSSGTTETTFPYDVLKDSPPEGVDLANKESYLSAPIFLSVFEMDSKSFECLPKWKKDLIKKKVGLF